jgi:hypothetical protein
MKEETKEIFLYFITIIISLNLFLLIINYLMKGTPIQLLWVCYIGMTILIIGFLRRNYNLVLSQVIILAIPDLLWFIDLVYHLITGNSFTGFASNIFTMVPYEKILFMQHLYTVPLAIFVLYLMKPPRKKTPALIFAFAEIAILFIVGISINPGDLISINCLPTPTSCSSGLTLSGIPYYGFWIAMAVSMITLSYLIIANLRFLKKKK